jgi:hypothetical protein
MPVCCCSLAGTKACITYVNSELGSINPNYRHWIKYDTRKPRVIEKFDKDGKLIERITES